MPFISLGARYMVLSTLGFALMGMFVKLSSARGIPVLEIVAARSLVSAVISFLDVKRKGIALFGQRKGLLLARGGVGALALFCVYYALVSMPFAEATMLQYLHPMFTAMLAVLFLKERLHFSTLLCLLFSFIGVIIIVQPNAIFGAPVPYGTHYGMGSESSWAVIAAVAGAFGSAVAYVLVRKLSATEDSSVIIFYFPIMAFPLSLLLLGDDFVMPEGITWLLLLCVGVSTQIGQVGLTKAMQTETASRATSFSYLQVVFAVVLGWLVFSEIPRASTLVGGALIILAVIVNVSTARKGV